MTCYYRDDEFLEVGQWLYNKFDKVSGISFLPYSEHTYQQAPYEPVDLETYQSLVKDFPKAIDWNISEASDMTEGSQQLACVGNSCEI
jgi:ribonucleoside-diphosphate reductase alpha chain